MYYGYSVHLLSCSSSTAHDGCEMFELMWCSVMSIGSVKLLVLSVQLLFSAAVSVMDTSILFTSSVVSLGCCVLPDHSLDEIGLP